MIITIIKISYYETKNNLQFLLVVVPYIDKWAKRLYNKSSDYILL